IIDLLLYLFFIILCDPPTFSLFPYTTLFRSEDPSGQCLRHQPEKENGGSENGHGDSRKKVRRCWDVEVGGASRTGIGLAWLRRYGGSLINEDHFEDDQVVVERYEAAEESEGDEPKQTVISAGAKGRAEKIEFPKKSGQRWQTGERQEEDRHRGSEKWRTRGQSGEIL